MRLENPHLGIGRGGLATAESDPAVLASSNKTALIWLSFGCLLRGDGEPSAEALGSFLKTTL